MRIDIAWSDNAIALLDNIYRFYSKKSQTAEAGLGDTVKPRLIEAAADLDRVLVIDEAKRELTLSDERIEKAITQNGARLIILDPHTGVHG